ncbi:MAG TPA: sugar phosphate nucleotidyltransferase [Candidatus Andersenbacteria bacterium]|nr:sugar phosphate nucleotidyltransferase [Candidatus Andersenbacteria bacterium]
MNIVIMAGGGGTRLWPLSRRHQPKQFLNLGSGKTLIEHTYDRARQLAEPTDIFIATNKNYAERIGELLPAVSDSNIFLEPEKRDTAPAFAAAAVELRLRGRENEPTIFMWSDHVFSNEAQFVADLKKIPALIAAHPQALVIMGHQPVFPEVALGYLEVGEAVAGSDRVFRVKAFKEKPDRATAERYLAAGNFYWNMAYISTTAANLLEQLRRVAPELMAGIDRYEHARRENNLPEADSIYQSLLKISIDHALLERSQEIIAVTGDWGWSDVGYWSTVREIFGAQGDHAPGSYHLHVGTSNCYVYNSTNQAVTLLGVKDLIVVVTPDAILVTNPDEAANIKDIIGRLEEDKKHDLL